MLLLVLLCHRFFIDFAGRDAVYTFNSQLVLIFPVTTSTFSIKGCVESDNTKEDFGDDWAFFSGDWTCDDYCDDDTGVDSDEDDLEDTMVEPIEEEDMEDTVSINPDESTPMPTSPPTSMPTSMPVLVPTKQPVAAVVEDEETEEEENTTPETKCEGVPVQCSDLFTDGFPCYGSGGIGSCYGADSVQSQCAKTCNPQRGCSCDVDAEVNFLNQISGTVSCTGTAWSCERFKSDCGIQAGCRTVIVEEEEEEEEAETPTKRPTEAEGINDSEVDGGTDDGMEDNVEGDGSVPTMMPVAGEEDEMEDTTSGGNVIQVNFASFATSIASYICWHFV